MINNQNIDKQIEVIKTNSIEIKKEEIKNITIPEANHIEIIKRSELDSPSTKLVKKSNKNIL
ncbi:MAG: hypothetical protein ACP5LH_03805 [Candidatus Micrarchaeia archaeon]